MALGELILITHSEKKLKSLSLQKGLPNIAYNLSGVSVVCDLATGKGKLNWIQGLYSERFLFLEYSKN